MNYRKGFRAKGLFPEVNEQFSWNFTCTRDIIFGLIYSRLQADFRLGQFGRTCSSSVMTLECASVGFALIPRLSHMATSTENGLLANVTNEHLVGIWILCCVSTRKMT